MREDYKNINQQNTGKIPYYSGTKWDNSRRRTNYRPYRSSSFSKNKFGNFLRHKLAVQFVICLLIFGVAVVTHNGQDPLRKTVQKGFNYLLNTELNYEPVLTKIVKIALQNEVLDWPNLHLAQEPTSKAVTQRQVMSLPVSGRLIKKFGWQEDALDNFPRFHEGVDIQAEEGKPVQSVLDGKVAKVGKDKVLGIYVQILHKDNLATLYAHLSEASVQVGDLIKEGDNIGKVGSTGVVEESHLHFEVREKGELIDPVTKMNLPGKENI